MSSFLKGSVNTVYRTVHWNLHVSWKSFLFQTMGASRSTKKASQHTLMWFPGNLIRSLTVFFSSMLAGPSHTHKMPFSEAKKGPHLFPIFWKALSYHFPENSKIVYWFLLVSALLSLSCSEEKRDLKSTSLICSKLLLFWGK